MINSILRKLLLLISFLFFENNKLNSQIYRFEDLYFEAYNNHIIIKDSVSILTFYKYNEIKKNEIINTFLNRKIITDSNVMMIKKMWKKNLFIEFNFYLDSINSNKINSTEFVLNETEEELLNLFIKFVKAGIKDELTWGDFSMIHSEKKLKELYLYGKVMSILDYLSFEEFKSIFTNYQTQLPKISEQQLKDYFWNLLYIEFKSDNNNKNIELKDFKLMISNNELLFDQTLNKLLDKGYQPFDKLNFKKIIENDFPLLDDTNSNPRKKNEQVTSKLIVFYFVLILILILILVFIYWLYRKYIFRKNVFSRIRLFIIKSFIIIKQKNYKIIEEYSRKASNFHHINKFSILKSKKKILEIIIIIWTFINTFFLTQGLIMPYQRFRQEFWFFNDEIENKYDLSEYFVYVGLPFLFCFLYKRYFKI
jgi:hypothetical protein